MSKFPVSLKIVCYRPPLHSLRTFASLICISIAHRKQSMFLLGAFPCLIFFTQTLKIWNFVHLLQTTFCKFYRHRKHLITADRFWNYHWPSCWHHMAACRWQWFRRRGGGEYSDCVRLFCFVTNVLNVTNDPHKCRISVLIIYFPKRMLS